MFSLTWSELYNTTVITALFLQNINCSKFILKKRIGHETAIIVNIDCYDWLLLTSSFSHRFSPSYTKGAELEKNFEVFYLSCIMLGRIILLWNLLSYSLSRWKVLIKITTTSFPTSQQSMPPLAIAVMFSNVSPGCSSNSSNIFITACQGHKANPLTLTPANGFTSQPGGNT